MKMPFAEDAVFLRAVQHHQKGELRQAEGFYRLVLQAAPGHPDANHNLGMIAVQSNQPAAGLPFLRIAVKARPGEWQFWASYIDALARAGDFDAAHSALKRLRKRGFPKASVADLARRIDVPAPGELKRIVELYEQRDVALGEPLVRQLLAKFPTVGVLWKALGLFLNQKGDIPQALAALHTALQYSPEDGEISYNIGVIEEAQGHIDAATKYYQQAVDLKHHDITARFNLASMHMRAERHIEAELEYRRVVAYFPAHDGAYNNLGGILRSQGRLTAAETAYMRFLTLRPTVGAAFSNLGVTFQETGDFNRADWYFQAALILDPSAIDAFYNYGNSLREQGVLALSERIFRRVLSLMPTMSQAANNLGHVLLLQGRLDEAEEMFAYSLRYSIQDYYNFATSETQDPNIGFAVGANEAGSVLIAEGRREDAEKMFERSFNKLALSDETALQSEVIRNIMPSQSNYLFAVNYHPDKTAEQIFLAYQDFERRIGLPLRGTWRPHGNNRDPDRRLKVGYVSPDFSYHSTKMFLEPLLARHDRNEFELYAFAELRAQDAMTERYKAMVDHWIPTRGFGDEFVVDKIREAGIDILVDLAGHTAGNRLAVFARKPAPVSATWMGYNYTTGLSAIDYFLTDEGCAPPGCDHLFAEQPWRLKDLAFSYRPMDGMGDVSTLPALARGYVTFGTLSRSVRINHRTIRVWADLLRRVENSKLVINSGNFKSRYTQDVLADKFMVHGIARDRLDIGCDSPPWDVLRRIDIAVDCFPHCSGTTLFESLYMGSPIVTLADRPSVGRLGTSILSALGRPEWIAQTESEYVDIAVALATDIDRLAAIRAGLRQEMLASPVMDEIGTTRRIEAAYRQMWRKWCESGQ